ncbi:MAG: thiamine pyrophosphate-binding protein [Gemmataceae bacterium]|nr:thiamine pyrophosphate-binding protein [Gemmataceae bacterium]
MQLTRREAMQATAAVTTAVAVAPPATAGPLLRRTSAAGHITGHLTGAHAVVAALKQQGVGCVFGIPGAQGNELWDAFKTAGLHYLLVTHEFSAAAMADGYARSTGCPGVIAVVPGPGLTNSLTGLGEALLDSIPVVALVGDVGNGKKNFPFQVHCLDQAALLRPVTKNVLCVDRVDQIPCVIQQAFAEAQSGEPGPVGVVIPYNLLIDAAHFHVGPPDAPTVAWDEAAVQRALGVLAMKGRVGIYAGQGCMNASTQLQAVAEMLQAPVATSISGKGAMPETHPLSVGWGYGPQGTETAEVMFGEIDLLLAVGVKFSEVATAYYSNPKPKRVIHVDANPANLGRVLTTDVCVTADAGLFFDRVLGCEAVRRPADGKLAGRIAKLRCRDREVKFYAKCGVDPLALILALRRNLCDTAQLFVDVCLAEHLAAEHYTAPAPRTYFCPTDNQAMGWSIPAALGAQAAQPGRCVVTLTGDGCFLMSAIETSTAARAGLPVKFFILDNQSYRYMQELQKPAYHQTTATILARLDYAALAQGFGLAYQEINAGCGLDESIQAALNHPGPVLVRVVTDYGDRKIRWIEAVRKKYTKELSMAQKSRFAARLGGRALDFKPDIND